MRFLFCVLVLFSAPARGDAPILVGAVLPLTGNLVDAAEDYRKGLLLWEEAVNRAGGMLGRQVQLRLLDDHSEATQAGRLYEQLIAMEKADLLVGPYGAAATMVAAATAERQRRPLVNATGALKSVQKAGTRYVFQVPAAFADYGAGALEIARAAGLRKLFVVARDDPPFREMAAKLKEDAPGAGLDPGEVEPVAGGARDYGVLIAKARAAGIDAWIGFGLPLDAAETIKEFRRLGYAPKMLLAQGAGDHAFLRLVGQDAEMTLGLEAYEPRARTRGNAEFVAAYRRKWSASPGLAAAQAFAAGRVLEEAVRQAGTLEPERVRDALAALETETPLGAHKTGPSGTQSGVRVLVLQVQNGRREIVWPEALASAKWQLPYPRWQERLQRRR